MHLDCPAFPFEDDQRTVSKSLTNSIRIPTEKRDSIIAFHTSYICYIYLTKCAKLMSCMFQHKQQAETLQWSVPQRRMLGPFHRERDKEGMILVDLGACEEVKKEHG